MKILDIRRAPDGIDEYRGRLDVRPALPSARHAHELIPIQAIELLTNSIITDPRGFLLTDPKWPELYGKQGNAPLLNGI